MGRNCLWFPNRTLPKCQWSRESESASRIQHGHLFLTVKFQIDTSFLQRQICEDFKSEINVKDKEQFLFFQADEVLHMY